MELVRVQILATVGGDAQSSSLRSYAEEVKIHQAGRDAALQQKGIKSAEASKPREEPGRAGNSPPAGWLCCASATASRGP